MKPPYFNLQPGKRPFSIRFRHLRQRPRRNHGLPTATPCIVQQGEAFHEVFQLQDS